MASRGYRLGASFEARRLDSLLKSGEAIKGARFYASKGITDIYYVKPDGTYHEEQCKYTSNPNRKPYISTEEFLNLLQFAMDNEGVINVYLTSKVTRRPVMVWKLN